jgi:hypothetical protein
LRTAFSVVPLRFSVLLLALGCGCASLDKDDCVQGSWYAIGVEDGSRGRPVERLSEHRRACAKYSIAPDAERYLAGRAEGLKSFCTSERGFSEGRAGRVYNAACPEPHAFLAGYNRGREMYDLHRQLDAVQAEIGRSKAALKAGIPNPGPRAREVERLEALSREADQLEARIREAESR